MDPEDKSGVDSLREQLYSRTNAPKERPRRRLSPDTHQIDESWEHIDELETEHEVEMKKKSKPIPNWKKQQKGTRSALTLIVLFSFGFFVVSAGISAYLFFVASNPVSPDNIDIEINGPLSIPGGVPLSLQFGIVNRNAVPIESANLIVDYPDGTRSSADVSVELDRFRETLGTVSPGERERASVSAILFGEEDSDQEILVTLEYSIEGSNAVFYKEKTYTVLLSSAPVALSVNTVKQQSSGQEIELVVNAISNSEGVNNDVLLTADYPFGFQFISAKPEPVAGNNVWDLGDLETGEEKEVVIRGVLSGQDNETRIFNFETGSRNPQSPTQIATVYHEAEAPVLISRPFIGLTLLLDSRATDGATDHVVRNNSTVEGTIEWVNTLPDPIYDIEIIASLDGTILDRRSIESRDGFYRSQDNTVIWNNETNRELDRAEPGDSGNVVFQFSPLVLDPMSPIANAAMDIDIQVRGRRISENNVPEVIEVDLNQRVIVASDLFLTGEVAYSSGPFTNTGPIPPKVEEETTYTITLNVANTSNNTTDVVMRSQVPWYVDWKGKVSPAGANVFYNDVSGELIWTIGSVPAGTGYTRDPISVSFQVGIEPSLSQRNTEPTILNEQRIEGVDVYTGSVIQTTRRALTTELTNDPEYSVGDSGRVVE